jgi:hypothetical protein
MSKQDCIKAIDLLLDDEWDDAHHIVQDLSDSYAHWIHAVVHKIEGDISNSNYWYSRSGLENYDSYNDIKDELNVIKKRLLDQ